jgi:hypothetical protein
MATNLTIGGTTFVCAMLSEADFTDVAAVYAILCVAQDGTWIVLDVGQSGQTGSRIYDHDRKACWARNCANNNVWVCIFRMPSSRYTREDREKFEAELRTQYRPPCGRR